MAASDGLEERRRERAERAAVEENGKVFFGLRISDGAVGVVHASSCRLRWGLGGGGGLRQGQERNIPEAIGGVAFSSDDDFVVFDGVVCASSCRLRWGLGGGGGLRQGQERNIPEAIAVRA